MKVIDVYSQYLEGHGQYNDVERKGALVKLTATSEEGNITYEVSVTFFPYRDPEDFVIPYDASFSKIIYQDKGRRSKKKEKEYLEQIQELLDELAQENGGEIYWDKPIRDAVYDM